MIAEWMAFAVLVSAALALSARAAEWGLERRGGAIRWLWVAAIAGAFALPLFRWSEARRGATPALALGAAVRIPTIDVFADGAGRTALGGSIDTLLVTAWGLVTLVLVLRLARQRRQLHAARRQWDGAVVDGHPVLLSVDAGPAIIGGRHPAVVLPRWVLDLPHPTRTLILQHEREHLRAGDAWVRDAARLACALVPWNPVLWYVERRLRAAIEVDCDRRVLRALPDDPRAYGALLLQVAGRTAPRTQLLPALSESYTLIARRLTIMTRPARSSHLLSFVAASASIVALIAACSSEPPKAEPKIPTGVQQVGPFRVTAQGDTQPNPGGAYFEFQVETPASYAGGMAPRFPEAAKASGTSGEVLAQFIVDTSGRAEVASYKVLKASDPQFAAAVREALPDMRFTPARVKGRAVRQLVQAPFSFDISK